MFESITAAIDDPTLLKGLASIAGVALGLRLAGDFRAVQAALARRRGARRL